MRRVAWLLVPLTVTLVAGEAADEESVQLSKLLTASGTRPGDHYGACVASAGDFNADGMDDLVVGVPGDDTKGENAGAVVVLSGRTNETLATYYGEGIGDRFGAVVGGAADIAFDGFDRIVVGAPGHDDDRGAAYVFGGSKKGLAFKIKGEREGDRLGSAVADAFDVSSDGVFDVVIGVPGHDGKAGEDCGRAVVVSGRSKSNKLRVLHEWEGAAPAERFGSAVATLKAAAPGKFHAVAVSEPAGPGCRSQLGKANGLRYRGQCSC